MIAELQPGGNGPLGTRLRVPGHPVPSSSTCSSRPTRRTAGRRPAGWDALVQARSGQQYEQPAWRPGPSSWLPRCPVSPPPYLVPDGILAALHARSRNGRGQRVETSFYQGVLAFTTMLWVYAEHNQNEYQSMMTKTYPTGGPPGRGHR